MIPLESEVFKLKGCSYHPPMQKALRIIQGNIAAKEELYVKIFEQPVNLEDENTLFTYEPVGMTLGDKSLTIAAPTLWNK